MTKCNECLRREEYMKQRDDVAIQHRPLWEFLQVTKAYTRYVFEETMKNGLNWDDCALMDSVVGSIDDYMDEIRQELTRTTYAEAVASYGKEVKL